MGGLAKLDAVVVPIVAFFDEFAMIAVVGIPMIAFFVVMNLKSSMSIWFRLLTAAFVSGLLCVVLLAIGFIVFEWGIQ